MREKTYEGMRNLGNTSEALDQFLEEIWRGIGDCIRNDKEWRGILVTPSKNVIIKIRSEPSPTSGN